MIVSKNNNILLKIPVCNVYILVLLAGSAGQYYELLVVNVLSIELHLVVALHDDMPALAKLVLVGPVAECLDLTLVQSAVC